MFSGNPVGVVRELGAGRLQSLRLPVLGGWRGGSGGSVSKAVERSGRMTTQEMEDSKTFFFNLIYI